MRYELHAGRSRSVYTWGAMKRWVAFGVVGLAIVVAVVAVLARSPGPTRARTTGPAAAPSGLDPLIEEFRATERASITRFNDLLRQQREQSIDELELANIIERDVLTQWRALRTRVEAARAQDELYSTLRRYIEARQLSWEAYVTALRAASDEAAKPHYEAHRQKNAEAQEEAKHLGRLFREAADRAGAK